MNEKNKQAQPRTRPSQKAEPPPTTTERPLDLGGSQNLSFIIMLILHNHAAIFHYINEGSND